MKKIITFAVLICMTLSGSAQKATVEYHQAQARQVEPLVQTFIHPKVAEMEVSPTRIEYSVYVSNEQVTAMGGNPSDLKAYVLAEACKEKNADVIVAAIYFIDSDDARKGYNVKVLGYPGIYNKWRDVQPGDYEWIKSVYGLDLGKDSQSKDEKSIRSNH